MNKAITEGLVLTPPPFADGLSVWANGDGTPGSATYDGDPGAALIAADQDFGGCLELFKINATQQLRHMGETPILPGCYLRITARVKAISGNLPGVAIAAWAGLANNTHAAGLVESGTVTTLTGYGEVVEVSAIVGTGTRGGVNMAWGTAPAYGHFGLDLTGASGGVVRIDDFTIEDVTSAYLRDMMDWVDVRDFGAVGDGVADDYDAFVAADAAAAGRDILVPEGTYLIGSNLTLENGARFTGTLTMADDKRLILRRNFSLQPYVDAFGDEVLGFKKAFQALLNFSDHDALDLDGLRIDVDAPIDMHDAVNTIDTWEVRRVIRNGQFNVVDSANWDVDVVAGDGNYSTGNAKQLTGVSNVANIQVGAHVTGNGVGREVYVSATNPGAGTVDLSQPLYGPNATQSYTFTRYKYVLDFSGFTKLSKFTLSDIELQCAGDASGILLAPAGETFQIKDSFVTKPAHRGITSIGTGCQDLQVDRCHFVSDEQSAPATSRVSLALNVNQNDAKIRDSRFQRFGTTMVLKGNGHLIVGNHWFQGDNVTDGPRVAGLVFTEPNVKSVLTGNYIDNCFVEWTNEHDATPTLGSDYSFGELAITGNIFTANDVATSHAWLVIKPHGADHYIQGLSVSGNTFKSLNGSVARVEKVDDSIAGLDFSRSRNVLFEGNTFNGISQNTINPVMLDFDQPTNQSVWTLEAGDYLPFNGWARRVSAIVVEELETNSQQAYDMPQVATQQGANKDQVTLSWPQSVHGKVQVTVRMDKPV